MRAGQPSSAARGLALALALTGQAARAASLTSAPFGKLADGRAVPATR